MNRFDQSLGRICGLLFWFGVLGLVRLPAQIPGPSTANPISAVPAVLSWGQAVTSATTGANVNLFTTPNIPANILQQPGGQNTSLWVRVHGVVANNANAKTIRLQFAGLTLDSLIVTASTANTWWFECTVQFRTAGPGAGNQSSFCHAAQGNGTATTIDISQTVSLDPTIAQAFTVQIANQTAGSDVTQNGLTLFVVQ